MSRPSNSRIARLDAIPSKSVSPEPVAAKPIVLIVDDEAVIADTLAAILHRNGFSTMTAYNGVKALEIACAIPSDLLLTDVAMPDMNGVDLAIAIRQTIPQCKILLFSGQAATTDLLASARKDGHDFAVISKPVHPTELLKRITEDVQSIPEKPLNDG